MGKRKHDLLTADSPTPDLPNVPSSLIAAACQLAANMAITRVLAFVDGPAGVEAAAAMARDGLKPIMVIRGHEHAAAARDRGLDLLILPQANLGRVDQVKAAVLFAVSRGLFTVDERFIALVGLAGGPIDTMMVVQASGITGQPESVHVGQSPVLIDLDIRPEVFERVMHVAITMASQGREGKPVGVLLVVGDTDRVLQYCDQMILNPFRGYAAEQRDIMDDGLLETLREFAILDGAFLIRGDGLIETAGAYLRPTVPGKLLPAGLGVRHAAAAGITATASCLAITISESTGTVRVWREGRIVTEIERSASPHRLRPRPRS